MSPSTPPTCNHDRGRGTTVCLRCRHEQAQASARRRQRFFIRLLGIASVAAVLAIAGVSAASTLRGSRATAESTSEGSVVADTHTATKSRTVPTPAPPKAAPVIQQSASQQSASEVARPAETPAAVRPDSAPTATPSRPLRTGGFVLVEGRTQLADSIYAMRFGDSVVVNFDAYGFRTRRSDRIEQSLRLTLPMVFGRMATASIDTLPQGGFVTNRDVIGELARSGMQVKLDNGAIAHIRVLTRVVSDGPIAIGYLTTIER
jgi:hypothetical protein